MQQGKSTVPQFQRTSLEQVEPVGKVQQPESDGLFSPEQSAAGDPEEQGVCDPTRCTRNRDVNRSTCVQGPGPQSDQPELRPGEGDSGKSRPPPKSMIRIFCGVVVVIVMVPLVRRSRIGMSVIASRMGGKSSFTLFFRLRRVVDEQRVEHRQNKQSCRLTGQQTAEDRPGQRGVRLAAALERESPWDEREEGRQRGHGDRTDPQAGSLADGLDRRQAFVAAQLLRAIGHQNRVGYLDTDDEDEAQQRLDVDRRSGQEEQERPIGVSSCFNEKRTDTNYLDTNYLPRGPSRASRATAVSTG